jgi:hypothetical protein
MDRRRARIFSRALAVGLDWTLVLQPIDLLNIVRCVFHTKSENWENEIGLAIANFCSEMILPPGASIYSLIAAYENAAADPLEVFSEA